MSGLAFPKPRPKALETRAKHASIQATDRAESEKARKRAGGRCEVWEQRYIPALCTHKERCYRRDSETHHMISGSGRRLKGRSLLAEHKLRVCAICHRDITDRVLKLVPSGEWPVWSDCYERVV